MSRLGRAAGEQGVDLSPAARATLDELLENVRTQAILEARRRAGEETVTASDIVEAFARATGGSYRPRQRGTRRVQQLILIYSILGVIALAVAAVALSLGGNESTSLLIATVGLSFGISSALIVILQFLRVRFRRANQTQAALSTAFIDLWISAESAVREIATAKLGASSNELPFTQLLSRLGKAGVLTPAEVDGLRKALRVRNAIMHAAVPGDGEIEMAGDFLATFLRSNLNLR